MRERDHRRGPDRNHEFRFGEPEPARQARSPPGLRVPQPGQPAQARPHRLHPRHPAALTRRNRQENTDGNRTETRSRLTSKSQKTRLAGGRARRRRPGLLGQADLLRARAVAGPPRDRRLPLPGCCTWPPSSPAPPGAPGCASTAPGGGPPRSPPVSAGCAPHSTDPLATCHPHTLRSAPACPRAADHARHQCIQGLQASAGHDGPRLGADPAPKPRSNRASGRLFRSRVKEGG